MVPAGAILQLWVTAANRDSRVFTDPDRFDVHRSPNPHLSFGHGIHFRLGAPLAHLEARVALRILLDRYRDIAVTEPVEEHNPWSAVRGRLSGFGALADPLPMVLEGDRGFVTSVDRLETVDLTSSAVSGTRPRPPPGRVPAAS